MQEQIPHAASLIATLSGNSSVPDRTITPKHLEAADAVLSDASDLAQIKPAFPDAKKEGPPAKPDISDAQKSLRAALLNVDRVAIALSNIAHDLHVLRASLVTALLRCNEAGKVDNAVVNITSDTTRQPATGPARIEEA